MRIAIISNAPLNALGGAGQIAGKYAELLSARGHEVHAWGACEGFSHLGTSSVAARLRFHLADLRENEKTVAEIQAWKPDVLLTHNLTGCGFGTPRILRGPGIRWVHVLHDVQLIEPSGQIIEGESFHGLRNMWRRVWSMKRHAAMGEPDVVVSPTKWLLDFHKKYRWFAKCRVEVIPNPIVDGSCRAERFSIPAIRSDEKTFLASPVDAGGVVYVGRVDPDKGIDILVDAWKKIEHANKRLVVVGDGTWLKRIRELNDPTIDVRGPLPNAEVRKIFAESNVAVLPSRVWENQPTVVLEGLACGCNVVAADVGGVRETLGDAGWVVRPNVADALAAGITAALDAPEDPKREKERERVLALHDPALAVGRLEGVLRSNL